MKKSVFTIVALLLMLAVSAVAQPPQKTYTDSKPSDKEENPVVFRDRLVMDVFHSFWMNMPIEVDHMKFDPGFNFAAIWDFKFKKQPLAVGLGVGITYHTQYSNSLIRYDKNEDVVKYYLLPENTKFNLLKMNYLNVNIPLEFRYRHQNGFKFSVGARVGLVANLSQKYKGNDPTNLSDTLMMKNLYLPNRMKYNVDFYTRIGWKFVSAYYSIQITPLFSEAKGPKIYPMSVGISLSLF